MAMRMAWEGCAAELRLCFQPCCPINVRFVVDIKADRQQTAGLSEDHGEDYATSTDGPDRSPKAVEKTVEKS